MHCAPGSTACLLWGGTTPWRNLLKLGTVTSIATGPRGLPALGELEAAFSLHAPWQHLLKNVVHQVEEGRESEAGTVVLNLWDTRPLAEGVD